MQMDVVSYCSVCVVSYEGVGDADWGQDIDYDSEVVYVEFNRLCYFAVSLYTYCCCTYV